MASQPTARMLMSCGRAMRSPVAFARPLRDARMTRYAASSFSTSRQCYKTIKGFTEAHEWIALDTDTKLATMGITDYAQNSLGDVVFIELPTVGSEIAQGDQIGGVESVKAASDIYAPVSGKVTEVNEKLADQPALLNKSPESDGWLCKIEVQDTKEAEDLMDQQKYKAFTAGEEH